MSQFPEPSDVSSPFLKMNHTYKLALFSPDAVKSIDVGQDAQFASDGPARDAPINLSGECKVMTSLMTDLLSGHFLRICPTKRQVPAQPSRLKGGLIEPYVTICRNVLTNTLLLLLLLLAILNAQSLMTLQRRKIHELSQ